MSPIVALGKSPGLPRRQKSPAELIMDVWQSLCASTRYFHPKQTPGKDSRCCSLGRSVAPVVPGLGASSDRERIHFVGLEKLSAETEAGARDTHLVVEGVRGIREGERRRPWHNWRTSGCGSDGRRSHLRQDDRQSGREHSCDGQHFEREDGEQKDKRRA
jgi:hypothetical protein